jgi:hypothetical protein
MIISLRPGGDFAEPRNAGVQEKYGARIGPTRISIAGFDDIARRLFAALLTTSLPVCTYGPHSVGPLGKVLAPSAKIYLQKDMILGLIAHKGGYD